MSTTDTAMRTATLRPIEFPAEAPAVVDLLTEINRHDKPGWFPSVEGLTNDWSPTGTFHPGQDLQGLELDGRLVGLARHAWRERPAVVNHRLEVYVLPDLRRQGLGSRLLDWAERRGEASRAEETGLPADKPHQYGGAASDAEAANAFAAARGYVPYRYHAEMRRPLADEIREAPLPEGLEVRQVLPEHHRRIWDADAESFRDHWDHAEPVEGDFERFFASPDIDTSMWQVAWDGDEVAGLVINAILPHENAQMGELLGWLDGVATRRPWRGRGVASALIARSLHVLRERGMETAVLGVDTENPTGAFRLYESFGFRPERRWTFYRKPF